jgi:hypothetical protein
MDLSSNAFTWDQGRPVLEIWKSTVPSITYYMQPEIQLEKIQNNGS